MANEHIRAVAKQAGVKLWEIADFCGIADTTLTRQMRKELPAERQAQFLDAIAALSAQKSTKEVSRCSSF